MPTSELSSRNSSARIRKKPNEPQAAPHRGQGRQESRARARQRIAAADTVVQKAIAAAQAGAFAEAERALTKCWRASRIMSKRCIRRACCWRAQIVSRMASRCCGGRPRQKPGEALYWNNLAAACLTIEPVGRGAVRRAARRWSSIRNTLMAWRNLAMASTDLGQHRDAAEALERPSRWRRTMQRSGAALGLAQLELSDAARAETAFAKAVALDPRECRMPEQSRRSADQAWPRRRGAAAPGEGRGDRTGAFHHRAALWHRPDADRRSAKALRWLRRATSIKPHSDTSRGARSPTRRSRPAKRPRRSMRPGAPRSSRPPIRPSRRACASWSRGATPRLPTLIELDACRHAASPPTRTRRARSTSTSLDQIFIR